MKRLEWKEAGELFVWHGAVFSRNEANSKTKVLTTTMYLFGDVKLWWKFSMGTLPHGHSMINTCADLEGSPRTTSYWRRLKGNCPKKQTLLWWHFFKRPTLLKVKVTWSRAMMMSHRKDLTSKQCVYCNHYKIKRGSLNCSLGWIKSKWRIITVWCMWRLYKMNRNW